MINEIKKEEIKKEAKRILDKFVLSLKNIKTERKELKTKEKGYRTEGEAENNEYFREIMFKNAPLKNKDCIIAEKKKW